MKKLMFALALGCLVAPADARKISRKKLIEDFEVAVSSFNPEKITRFYKETAKLDKNGDVLKFILNGDSAHLTGKNSTATTTNYLPGMLTIISVAYQMEPEAGIRLIQEAIDHGADVTRSFDISTEDIKKTDRPISVAIMMAYVFGNTKIVELLCNNGALRGMSNEEVETIIESWHNEMQKNFQIQFTEQKDDTTMDELMGTVDARQSILAEFEAVHKALQEIVKNAPK